MENTNLTERRPLHRREEFANSISHGLALVLAVAALPVLILSAARIGNTRFTFGVVVFGATIIFLYLASTLYHSLTHERAKQFFRHVDHCAIFLLIAGSYTPFTLGVLRGPWGWTLLTIIWCSQ
jgi:hemolysin III